MGAYYQSQGKWAAAELAFGQAVRLSRYEPEFVNDLLNVMQLAKRWQPLIDRAEKIVREAEAVQMAESRLQRTRVICYIRASHAYTVGLENQARGDELLLKGIDLAVKDEGIRRWVYGALLSLNRRDKAIELLAKSLAAEPTNHKLRMSLAWLYFRKAESEGRKELYEKSGELLQEVVAELSQEKQAWAQLGLVYYNLEMDDEAKGAFDKALQLDASDFATLNNYAWFLSDRLGEHEKALELARRAAALQPKNATVLDTVGWIEYLSEQPQKALSTLRQSVELGEIAANTYHLAVVYEKRGKGEDRLLAQALARKAIHLDPNGKNGEYGKRAKVLLDSLGG